MKSKYSEFFDFLEKYRDELRLALSNEREKRQALLSSDMNRLEIMLQIQQAETMKLKGFENKRIALQSELGLENQTAVEIIAAIDDSETRETLKILFSEIMDLANRIKEQNKLAIELASTNLKIVEKVFNNADSNAQNSTYGPESGKQHTYSKGSSFKETM